MTDHNLPTPDCQSGYTNQQLHAILGERYDHFAHWMRGQTGSICDGQRYNHDTKEYEPTGCGPHGIIVYPWDLQRFLDGKPIID